MNNEDAVKALRVAQGKASQLMHDKANNPHDLLAGEDPRKLTLHGTIVKESFFGGYNFETGDYVARGNQLYYGPFGKLIGQTNFGALEKIGGATAVVLVYPGTYQLNFDGIRSTFSQLDQVTPVFISQGGRNFVIEGSFGPQEVNF